MTVRKPIVLVSGGLSELPAADTITGVSTWTAPTLNTGWISWSTSDSAWQAVQYGKDAAGHVWMRGLIHNLSAASTTMFTLPSGFRPAKRQAFWGGAYEVIVEADGSVKLNSPALSSGTQYIPLDVAHFWPA